MATAHCDGSPAEIIRDFNGVDDLCSSLRYFVITRTTGISNSLVTLCVHKQICQFDVLNNALHFRALRLVVSTYISNSLLVSSANPPPQNRILITTVSIVYPPLVLLQLFIVPTLSWSTLFNCCLST